MMCFDKKDYLKFDHGERKMDHAWAEFFNNEILSHVDLRTLSAETLMFMHKMYLEGYEKGAVVGWDNHAAYIKKKEKDKSDD